MVSKEEAESILLKTYYQLGMDELYGNSPETAEINFFEKSTDPEHLEHNWHFNRDKTKLLLQMWAVDYETGAEYMSGTFAYMAAIKSQKSFLFKRWHLIQLIAILAIIGFDVLSVFLLSINFWLGIIPILLIGAVLFLHFYFRKVREKKLEVVYFENLRKIPNIIETKPLEKYSNYFFKLHTKVFFSSILLVLLGCLSILIGILNAFTGPIL